MYLAFRDLRHAKGRFALIVAAVALMTVLVGFLSGLTGGLASQNISSLLSFGADRVAFAMPQGQPLSYATSRVTEEQVASWRKAPGVEEALPLGIATVLVEGPNGGEVRADDAEATYLDGRTVALLASDQALSPNIPNRDDALTLGTATAADLGVVAGDTVTIAGRELTVATVAAPMAYSHLDVAWAPLSVYRQYLADTRQLDSFANVVVVRGDVDAEVVDAAAGTSSSPLWQSLLALEAFKSEIDSLGLMIGMLVAIAVLVIGVFFLIWSMQRQRDIAVLKALGATDGWLRADALGQALLVLVIGAASGIGATVGLGTLTSTAMPFVLDVTTMALPAVGMILAGLIGALVSLRQITRVDPLVALAAAA